MFKTTSFLFYEGAPKGAPSLAANYAVDLLIDRITAFLRRPQRKAIGQASLPQKRGLFCWKPLGQGPQSLNSRFLRPARPAGGKTGDISPL